MKKILYIPVFIFLLTLLQPVATSAQCPMCKANVESTMKDESLRKTGTGLNKGIMLLAAMPYSIFMIIGILWYRNTRQKRKAATPRP